VIKCLTENMCL